MTQQETLEYNKRCAELLNYTFKYYTDDKNKKTLDVGFVWGSEAKIFKQCNAWWRCTLTPNDNFSWYFPNDLKFHSDWNWIMEVVEKIQSLDKLGGIVMIQQGRCKITSRMAGDHSVYADVSLYFTKGMKGQKEAVIQAINQFLIWYNENKTN